MSTLRPYQIEAIQRLRETIAKGCRRVILQAPTGAGKTLMAAEVIRRCMAKGNSVLFFSHRREIIQQSVNKLRDAGINPGVIMSGEERDYGAKVQVASVQTLWARAFRKTRMDLPQAELVVIDECHLSASMTYQKIIAAYPNAVILGLTATPVRSDERGLGDTYSGMVKTASVRELTEMGFLVPVRYFSPTVPDLEGIKITAGDYNKKQLENRVNTVKLVGDVVENWARIARDRQTVVFASGVKHSIHLREAFRTVGITAEHIDGNTPKHERDEILGKLASNKVQVVTNCAVLQEGWDSPPVSCAVLARPTKSLGLYLQMAGRILRPFPGKENALIVDHSGAVYQHGRVEEYDDWILTKGREMLEIHQAKKKAKGKNEITCLKCSFIYFGRRDCPNCGHSPETFGKGVEYKDGYLYEVGVGAVESKETKTQWMQQLLWYARDRGFADGWANHQYKARFTVWPRSIPRNPIPPGPEVLAFIRKQTEKWKKERESVRRLNVPTSKPSEIAPIVVKPPDESWDFTW